MIGPIIINTKLGTINDYKEKRGVSKHHIFLISFMYIEQIVTRLSNNNLSYQ